MLLVLEAMLETRSASKASDLLSISQPSVSNALARLRKTFDDPMFIRVKISMEPTPRGIVHRGAGQRDPGARTRRRFPALDVRTAGRYTDLHTVHDGPCAGGPYLELLRRYTQ